MQLLLSLVLVIVFSSTLAFKLPRVVAAGLISASLSTPLMAPSPAHAAQTEKASFLEKASNKKSIENEMLAKEVFIKGEESKTTAAPIEGVRLIDLGGNRGARGLATSSNMVSPGGSLADQLKAYGGIGEPEKVDNSIKNPLKFKSGIKDQLSVYQKLQQ